MIQFNTDLEGPLTKNDNAFELCSHFLERGDKFFNLISGYDDVLGEVIKRKDYEPGGTLRLILPFFKAYGLTDEDIRIYSEENLDLMPGAKDVLELLRADKIPCFIIGSGYQHYMRATCKALDFPFENTYCTKVNIDEYQISKVEQKELRSLYKEIISMSVIKIPPGATSLKDFSREDQETIERLEEIFWEKISRMEAGRFLREVKVIGGRGKVEAIRDSMCRTGLDINKLIYIGDSITDAEALAFVKREGGVAIAFNGNRYALRYAEIACLSESTWPLYAIAKTFQQGGKQKLLDLIKKGTLSTEGTKLTTTIDEQVIEESKALRERLRGEQVGALG
jgi:energy-converting hydrogenase A subunit R